MTDLSSDRLLSLICFSLCVVAVNFFIIGFAQSAVVELLLIKLLNSENLERVVYGDWS